MTPEQAPFTDGVCEILFKSSEKRTLIWDYFVTHTDPKVKNFNSQDNDIALIISLQQGKHNKTTISPHNITPVYPAQRGAEKAILKGLRLS